MTTEQKYTDVWLLFKEVILTANKLQGRIDALRHYLVHNDLIWETDKEPNKEDIEQYGKEINLDTKILSDDMNFFLISK